MPEDLHHRHLVRLRLAGFQAAGRSVRCSHQRHPPDFGWVYVALISGAAAAMLLASYFIYRRLDAAGLLTDKMG